MRGADFDEICGLLGLGARFLRLFSINPTLALIVIFLIIIVIAFFYWKSERDGRWTPNSKWEDYDERPKWESRMDKPADTTTPNALPPTWRDPKTDPLLQDEPPKNENVNEPLKRSWMNDPSQESNPRE